MHLRVAARLFLSDHTASALPMELRQFMRNVSHSVFRRLCGLVFPGKDNKSEFIKRITYEQFWRHAWAFLAWAL